MPPDALESLQEDVRGGITQFSRGSAALYKNPVSAARIRALLAATTPRFQRRTQLG